MAVRIFLASDLHGSRRALEVLPNRAREQAADVVVLAGDISHKGRPEGFLAALVAAFAPAPVIGVPGNMDPPAVHGDLSAAGGHWVHGRRLEVAGRGWAGFGGSTPHPLGGPYQVPEGEIAAGLAAAEPGDVLVVHNPPRGILDKTRFIVRAGSRAVLEAVERLAPPLVLSGHVHEARGVERRGATLFVNAGPGKRLRSALVTLDDEGGATAELSAP